MKYKSIYVLRIVLVVSVIFMFGACTHKDSFDEQTGMSSTTVSILNDVQLPTENQQSEMQSDTQNIIQSNTTTSDITKLKKESEATEPAVASQKLSTQSTAPSKNTTSTTNTTITSSSGTTSTTTKTPGTTTTRQWSEDY